MAEIEEIETREEYPLQRTAPKLSKPEIGRLRKIYITQKHPVVLGCNHRLDLSRHPRHRHCDNCWFAYFQNNGEATQTAEEALAKESEEFVANWQGHVFAKNLKKFLGTIAKMVKEQGVKDA